MRAYLIFRLEAPLASFGTIAVGERRPSWDRPSKSQVVGFLAAALGIERADEQRQSALAAQIGLAVRADDPGQLLQDYHTAQQPRDVAARRRAKAGAPITTRREELDFGPDDIETTLSRREYRRDAAYTIAVWLQASGPATLQDMADKIAAPCFQLAAGRRANTLMFPCGPHVTGTEPDIMAALATFDAKDAARRDFRESRTPRWLVEKRHRAARTIYADEGVELPPTHQIMRYEERRDVPHSRAGWRFLRRTEVVIASTEEARS